MIMEMINGNKKIRYEIEPRKILIKRHIIESKKRRKDPKDIQIHP